MRVATFRLAFEGLLTLRDCEFNSTPSWCFSYWCFVDSENCTRPFAPAIDVNMTAQLYLGYGSAFTEIDCKCYLI